LGRLAASGNQGLIRPWTPGPEDGMAIGVHRQGNTPLLDDAPQQQEIALGLLNTIRYSL
jgi:hypothetical protein